jgi:membrane protein required for colicin V production
VIGWPDLIILVIAVIFAIQGWRRGFVIELGGFIALVAAVAAAFSYPGIFDGFIRDLFNLSEGSAHIAGMVFFGVLVYVVLAVLSAVLVRFAKLPVFNLIDAIAGAFVGVIKAMVGVWVVLYFVLFLPLSRDVRGDLQRSGFVALISQADAPVDNAVRSTLPWYMQPMTKPLFDRHKL